MKNEKLEIIESNEFQNLFDKSKKLIDSARSNMGQMANAITVLPVFCLEDILSSRNSKVQKEQNMEQKSWILCHHI